jgi:hypothetical protein
MQVLRIPHVMVFALSIDNQQRLFVLAMSKARFLRLHMAIKGDVIHITQSPRLHYTWDGVDIKPAAPPSTRVVGSAVTWHTPYTSCKLIKVLSNPPPVRHCRR